MVLAFAFDARQPIQEHQHFGGQGFNQRRGK